MSKGFSTGSCSQTGKFHAAGFFFFFLYKWEESSGFFSVVPWTGIRFSPSFLSFFCPTDKESRLQTVPAYISGWVAVTQCPVIQSPFSLSSMLMNPYPTSLCWRHAWNCPTQHSANVTAWLGYTADVFVEVVLQHRTLLVLSIFSAHSVPIYIHHQIFWRIKKTVKCFLCWWN